MLYYIDFYIIYNIVNILDYSKPIPNDWTIIQNFSLPRLESLLIGKKVEMEASCDLFPNFHASGVVTTIEQSNTKNACLIYVKTNKASIKIDGGMNKLRYREL